MNKYARLEAKHQQDKYIIAGVLVTLVILGGLMMWLSTKTTGNQPNGNIVATSTASSTITFNNGTSTVATDKIVAFAKYLAANQITMYGAAWCTHCQDQKKAFGSAWQYVPYVECPENTKICLERGIEGYPTWRKPTGEKIAGFQELEALAAWAGYEL